MHHTRQPFTGLLHLLTLFDPLSACSSLHAQHEPVNGGRQGRFWVVPTVFIASDSFVSSQVLPEYAPYVPSA